MASPGGWGPSTWAFRRRRCRCRSIPVIHRPRRPSERFVRLESARLSFDQGWSDPSSALNRPARWRRPKRALRMSLRIPRVLNEALRAYQRDAVIGCGAISANLTGLTPAQPWCICPREAEKRPSSQRSRGAGLLQAPSYCLHRKSNSASNWRGISGTILYSRGGQSRVATATRCVSHRRIGAGSCRRKCCHRCNRADANGVQRRATPLAETLLWSSHLCFR